jgi:hypothetical protein
MKRHPLLKSLAAFSLCLFAIATSAQGVKVKAVSDTRPPDKKEILRQARTAYYSLADQGMNGFECEVTPDWPALLANERKTNPEGADAAVQKLSQLRFHIALGPDGKVVLTHSDLQGESQQMNDALKQIYSGMEQMASGFFDTWKLFVLNPPFPAVNSQYNLEPQGTQYLLSYKEDAADVATTMGTDFAISRLKVTTPEFDSAIWPKFTRIGSGFLMTSYEASYVSQKAEETTQLKVQIDYQEVSGLQLIRALDLAGSYGGTQFAVLLKFSGCSLKKH